MRPRPPKPSSCLRTPVRQCPLSTLSGHSAGRFDQPHTGQSNRLVVGGNVGGGTSQLHNLFKNYKLNQNSRRTPAPPPTFPIPLRLQGMRTVSPNLRDCGAQSVRNLRNQASLRPHSARFRSRVSGRKTIGSVSLLNRESTGKFANLSANLHKMDLAPVWRCTGFRAFSNASGSKFPADRNGELIRKSRELFDLEQGKRELDPVSPARASPVPLAASSRTAESRCGAASQG